ncbi:hypothetical protein HOD88_00715 [archaeon]|jgi:hypothetical protein|nr:hypothetical protein [archaeon]
MVTGYCVKCGRQDKESGKNKEMKDPEIHQTARGGYMAKGTCPACGTKMCAMMSKDNAEKAITEGVKKAF